MAAMATKPAMTVFTSSVPPSLSPPASDASLAPTMEKPPSTDGEAAVPWDWDTDAANPYNWPPRRKRLLVGSMATTSLLTSIGTSILSPAHAAFMSDFGVSTTAAILPLTLYVVALGIGPIFVGGPLSEAIGRSPISLACAPLGALFLIGAALCPTSSFAGFCVLRFLAGFVLSPSLAIASGVLTETFRPLDRGLPSALFILTPFLGPGMGPVLGAFAMRKGWPWTQWTLVFFAAFSILMSLVGVRETYHPIVRRRRMRQLGIAPDAAEAAEAAAASFDLRHFLTVGLLRPLHMLVAEPIVGLSCLYVACEFATLFSFFAAVPYVFALVYGFGREPSGLVFLAIVVGCVLGLITVMACDVLIYRRVQVPRYAAAAVPTHPPPEHRLYAAMVGSLGLPVALFWFGWAADHHHTSWVPPVVAIVPFAWGNICIFISLMQYMGDAYTGAVVASAASANSLARYCLAGVFPLFTLQMYEHLGIGWASSLLGFLAAALLPVPWLFFKFGPQLRARSRYV